MKFQSEQVVDKRPVPLSVETLIVRKRQAWPEVSSAAGDLVTRLFRLRDLVHEASRREIKERFGLTQAEFEVIVTLRASKPPYCLTPTELRQSMFITPGGLTKVMRNLDVGGLVLRRPSGNDGRSWLIQLTDKGIRLAEEILPVVQDGYTCYIGAGLKPKEAKQLSGLLAKALHGLEDCDNGDR